MTRLIKRRSRALAMPHRQIKRRSKPHKWPYTYQWNKDFLKYFRSVTGIQVGKESDRELSRFLLTDPNADNWLRTSKDFHYIKPNKMVPFGEDRKNVIRWHKLLRDDLQKCWDKYIQRRKIRRR